MARAATGPPLMSNVLHTPLQERASKEAQRRADTEARFTDAWRQLQAEREALAAARVRAQLLVLSHCSVGVVLGAWRSWLVCLARGRGSWPYVEQAAGCMQRWRSSAE